MFRTLIRKFCLEAVGRLPLGHGLLLLLLLGERAKNESYPPFPPYTIYALVGILLACTVCMGFNMKRQFFSVVFCLQLLILAYLIQTNTKLNYRDWVKIRLWYRLIGIAGTALLYGHFTQKNNPVESQLRRLGETLVGIYLVSAAYIVVESPEDKQAFLKFVPGGNAALYVYVVLIAAAALCYLPGYFVHDVTQAVVILISAFTAIVDCQFNFWTKSRGLHFWLQAWLVACNVNVILGFIMYLVCTEKLLYDDNEIAGGDAPGTSVKKEPKGKESTRDNKKSK